jgi:uncharacterized protein (TIGR02453 family)
MVFTGFPPEAFEFYEQLEADNSKSFWLAHKDVYERACRQPMEALFADLEAGAGPGKIFRPNRDVRFSADKSPYKTSISGHNEKAYISLSADGLYVGGGGYMWDPPALVRYRAAVDDDRAGRELERIVIGLEKKGYEIGGEALKSAPRGFSNDHPRIRLLRNKGLHAGRLFPPDPWLSTKAALTRVKKVIADIAPLRDWVGDHVS